MTQPVIFPRTVTDAAVGVTGHSLGYAPSGDHHVGRLEVTAEATTNDNVVTVTATLGVRDWSGNWDDDYQGSVDFVVLAELEPIGAPEPRGDLVITGVELNQAVQFFRSDTYLDPAHSLPDNAVWMIARKNVGVRVYVDYDASAGLPPISNLTGSLEVETASAGTLTFNPINAPIIPRPDNAISLAVANHTLNFMIPAAWCTGTVTIRCQVWDADAPDPKSAAFTRTLVFTTVAPLNLHVVGVAYTGGGLNLPAPTQAQFTSQSLPQLIKTYPVGDVVQSGFTPITFGETVTGLIGGSCTSGFSHLLDRLSDLRGGSSDIYVGVLPAGVINTPGNQIGGCARVGLAAVFLDFSSDLPHEIGHAFGRQHAPCTPAGRCSPSPANVDPNYPQYGTFPSDSIGVFGFDATTNAVFDPAATSDFMAYSFPQWVSAYTYLALRGAFPAVGGPGGGGRAHHVQGVEAEYLYLGLSVSRDRTVERRHSFHHPGLGLGALGCGDFTVELADENGDVLLCVPLQCGCEESGCHCWPREIRDAIPWPDGVRKLSIWEDDELIYEEDVPDPPEVEITSATEQADGVLVKWSARRHDREDELWYVVHWYDDKDEVWRGVAPRQQEKSLLIPRSLLRTEHQIRVLATSGIATGFAERAVKLAEPDEGEVTVLLAGSPVGSIQEGGVLRAVAVDETGRELPSEMIYWYDNSGAQIGRGNEVDLRGRGIEPQLVRAVVRHSDGLAAKGWLSEVSPAGIKLHHEVIDPQPASREQHQHPHPAPKPAEDASPRGKGRRPRGRSQSQSSEDDHPT